MSEKNLDSKGRWRSKTIAFRVSPEEEAKINQMVKLSGHTKQEYLTANMLQQHIVVQGNPRVFISLKRELEHICAELKRIEYVNQIDSDFKKLIQYALNLLEKLNKNEKENMQ